MQLFVLSCGAAFLVGLAAVWVGRRLPEPWLRATLYLPAALLLAYGSLPLWWLVASARGDGGERIESLGDDVEYRRLKIGDSKRAVAHVAEVDLTSACVAFTATLPDSTGSTEASTGTEFVNSTGAVVSINVAFFYPFEEYPHWATYPTSGDPVTAIGYVMADGVSHGTGSQWGNYLVLQPEGDGHRADVGALPINPESGLWAVPGRTHFVRGGAVAADDENVENVEYADYPRTAIAVDQDSATLFLVVVDGKQPGYSRGINLADLGDFLVGLGADEALELDGGGSATMAATVDGQVELLSRPSHTRIPGRQRPVASHFGIVDQCQP